jgi:O-Antigen ligase
VQTARYLDGATRAAPAVPRPAAKRLSIWVTLFVIGLVVPWILQIGPIRLSAYRIVLLAVTVPCVFMWLGGRAGKPHWADFAILMVWLWTTLGYLVVHGPGVAVEAGGILFLESFGAYTLARCFIRSEEDFHNLARLLFGVVLFLLPFAVIEAVTSRNLLLELFDAVIQSHPDVNKNPRWGLRRVQGPFEHPILFGVVCSSILAITYYVLGYGKPFFARAFRAGIVTFTSALSLSSGPLTAMVAQILLIGWDTVLRQVKARWKILAAGVLSLWVLIELFANRPAAAIFISYFAFNTRSAYNRIHIWNYGTASVADHPFFGVGFNEWERAYFMSTSIDMFWLAPAVRNGLPTALFLHLAFILVFLGVARKEGLSEKQQFYRKGFLFSMMGFYLAGWTVNYWNATYVLFMFLLGSGVWLLDVKNRGTG